MPKKLPSTGRIRWDFPSTGHGEEQGFNDSQLEYFEGDHERFIARETIQNAVDARLDSTRPVRVIFEYRKLAPKDIPGYSTITDVLKRCLDYSKTQDRAVSFFKNALELLQTKTIPVLAIRDYNTTGLSGSDEDHSGHWYRLVKVAGTSSPKGVAGGSFGIGKGAPFAASNLRTVFYSSINDKGGIVFQGKARLVSHFDDQRDVKQGIGFYGIDGHKAIRDSVNIPKFFQRAEQGTDIYVIGYKSTPNWKNKLINSVLQNFWLAILSGDLEVEIKDGKEMAINQGNLADVIEKYEAEDVKNYFDSWVDPTQEFEATLNYVGKVILKIKKQDGYPGKIMMARKPKMMVLERQFRALREPYAGVFLCDDERGNRVLRDLEPPEHNKWERYRKSFDLNVEGHYVTKEIEDFIKDSLVSMGENITGEPQDIPGLDQYLPDSEDRDLISQGGQPVDPSNLGADRETSREIGRTKEPAFAEIETVIRKGIISNKQPGKVILTPPRGSGNGRTGRATGPTPGDEAGVLIKTSNISFRCFAQEKRGEPEYHLALGGKENCEGGIRIVAIGDDGNYPIDLEDAVDLENKKEYEIAGSMIKGLKIAKGQTMKVAVRLRSKKKYSLGIENYEG